jgi:hypothetical protein
MNAGRNFRRRGDKRNAEKFVMLPVNLFVRPEFASLPPPARVIYVDMAKLYRPPWDGRPGNNGKIWYGCRQGSYSANISFGWAAEMLRRIEESGAASITSRTAFNKKDSHKAQKWELAIYPTYGAVPRPSSAGFRCRSPAALPTVAPHAAGAKGTRLEPRRRAVLTPRRR